MPRRAGLPRIIGRAEGEKGIMRAAAKAFARHLREVEQRKPYAFSRARYGRRVWKMATSKALDAAGLDTKKPAEKRLRAFVHGQVQEMQAGVPGKDFRNWENTLSNIFTLIEKAKGPKAVQKFFETQTNYVEAMIKAAGF